jgi:hypothetical protein
VPPPEPRHIVAQQILALCLQQGRVGDQLWPAEWNGLAPFDKSAEVIIRYLREHGYLDTDGEMLFIGPEAELRFGRRHFMGMTAVFTAPPQFTVLSGAYRDRLHRPGATHLEGPRAAPAAPGRPQLAGHSHRLDPPAVLRRTRGQRRESTVDDRRRTVRPVVPDGPRDA